MMEQDYEKNINSYSFNTYCLLFFCCKNGIYNKQYKQSNNIDYVENYNDSQFKLEKVLESTLSNSSYDTEKFMNCFESIYFLKHKTYEKEELSKRLHAIKVTDLNLSGSYGYQFELKDKSII